MSNFRKFSCDVSEILPKPHFLSNKRAPSVLTVHGAHHAKFQKEVMQHFREK
jgi:hypothetical protein